MFHAAVSVFLVEMDNHFGVSCGAEGVPEVFELATELLKIIDLAVEYHPHRAILVAYRLMARLDINDAEAAHGKARAPAAFEVQALVVRTAMHQCRAHPPQFLAGDGSPVQTDDTDNAAHVSGLLSRIRLQPVMRVVAGYA